jgi:hypothetical protein
MNKEKELRMNVAVLAVLLVICLLTLLWATFQVQKANQRAKFWEEQYELKQ